MKKQNGITLIALIITIIVMLILVAVTISVALNGGLFERAKNAKDDTQIQADREELLSYVIGSYNSRGDFDATEFTQKITPEGWTVVDNQDGTLSCSKGNNVFIVNKTTGEITNSEAKIKLATTTLNIQNIGDTGAITGLTLIGLSGNITWSSSNEGVATVTGNNQGATVTAVAEGTAIITAELDGKTATCTVTVQGALTPAAPTGIHVGDEWTNVSFTNLPASIPNTEGTVFGFSIYDQTTNLEYICSCMLSGGMGFIDVIGVDKNYTSPEAGIIGYAWQDGMAGLYAGQWTQTRVGYGEFENMTAPVFNGTITAVYADGHYEKNSDSWVLTDVVRGRFEMNFNEEDDEIIIPNSFLSWLSGTIEYAE